MIDQLYMNIQALVLAAGKSTRFKRNRSKLTEKICGQEMILFPTILLSRLGIKTAVITGYQRVSVEKVVQQEHGNTVSFVHQEELLGTGHAVLAALPTLDKEHILIMNGDAPLVTEEVIQSLINHHRETNATVSFVIAHNADPAITSYGTVINDEKGIRIVEAKDLESNDISQQENCCVNAGIYLINKEFLVNAIKAIQKSSVTGEIYLTELVRLASEQGLKVTTTTTSFDLIRGVNNLKELWAVEHIKRAELILYWMNQGIRFSTVQSVHIDLGVHLGSGTSIGANVQIIGSTVIGNNCSIGAFSILENATIEDGVTINSHCVVKDSYIAQKTIVGPFAHIHTKSHIGQETLIGNFVEIKKSFVGNNTKMKHLSYCGDAHIGEKVNIGAGTITCNHDGEHKHITTIKDGAYIGSNNTLIAPVTINEYAYTAAGSVITHDVPDRSLAIARTKQINKLNYAYKLNARLKNEEQPSCAYSEQNHSKKTDMTSGSDL